MLLPQADIADPRLRRGLEARGASVQAVTAYRTVDYPADPRRGLSRPAGPRQQEHDAPVLTPAEAKAGLDAGTLHAVVAASPSAVRRVHSELSPLGSAASSRSDGLRRPKPGPRLPVDAVAEEPTVSGLVAAVIAALDPGQPTPHPVHPQTVKDQT